MEVELGKQCSFDYCKIHDHLPFLCKYCKKLYCLSHQSVENHQCRDYEDLQRKQEFCKQNKLTIKDEKDFFLICKRCKGLIKINGIGHEHEDNLQIIKRAYDNHEQNECQKVIESPKYCFVRDCIFNKYCINSNSRKCVMCDNYFCFSHMNTVNHTCEGIKKSLSLNREEIKLKFQKRLLSNSSSTIRENKKSQIIGTSDTDEKKRKMHEKVFKIKVKLTAVGLPNVDLKSRVFIKIVLDKSVDLLNNSFNIGKNKYSFRENRDVNMWLDGNIVIGKIMDELSYIFKGSVFTKNKNQFSLYKILKYKVADQTFDEEELSLLNCSAYCRNVLNDGDVVLLK